MNTLDLLAKYDVPVPRYTSYPTVPYWQDTIEEKKWEANLRERFIGDNSEISLYIHLPFCESLCTYCGCNKKITANHSVEDEYMKAIIAEWRLYRRVLNQAPVIKELHIGGGTPTFFSPARLQELLTAILDESIIPPVHEFSFEGHPNNTTEEHLRALYDLGFTRVSFGVQDNDSEVQHIINRIQPFENVQRVTDLSRQIGYHSVNFDLIYGLPLQTPGKMERTLRQAISLRPDRVAFYSYAHVPWTSKGQRLFDERHLPLPHEKIRLYHLGKEIFAESGYRDIGMDHFSLPADALYQAAASGRLYRNFMGYTTQNSKLLLGLGVSAISDTGAAFAQNTKSLHEYYTLVHNGALPVRKGYFLNEEDTVFRRYILDVVCNGHTRVNPSDVDLVKTYALPLLQQLREDGLITFDGSVLQVTQSGRGFLRNIASVFDMHLRRSAAQQANKFSRAI